MRVMTPSGAMLRRSGRSPADQHSTMSRISQRIARPQALARGPYEGEWLPSFNGEILETLFRMSCPNWDTVDVNPMPSFR